METERSSKKLIRIIVVLTCLIGGITTITPLFMDTFIKNIWSQKYFKHVMGVVQYEDELISPPEGHVRASIWLARDAFISSNLSTTYKLLEPSILLRDPFALSILGDVKIFEKKVYDAIEIWADIRDVYSLLEYAKFAEAKGDWAEALYAYKNIVNLDPGNSKIYYTIGQIYAKQNKYSEADRWLKRAIELNPNQKWKLIRARVANDAGNLTLSQSIYEQLIKQFPETAHYYYEVAWIYYLDHKYIQAESSIESALRYLPLPKVSYYLRAGRIYEKVGKFKNAIEAYETILFIRPEHKGALKRLNILYSSN